jgi:defect-in-organelle-trafficking protein DotC
MLKKIILVALSLALIACSHRRAPADPASEAYLMGLTGHKPTTDARRMNRIRFIALKDTALSVGARAGLSKRAFYIDHLLAIKEKTLDKTYNFYGLLLPNDIIPPVLAEADNTLVVDDPDTLRLSQRVYKIVKQAHFVTAPPTWRDYLWMNYPRPEVPNMTLLPRNPQERAVWKHYIDVGFRQGMRQADSIFEADLARLRRDYTGMILYKKLYAQNMVSAPFVAKTELGITGSASHMRIEDRLLRITAHPALNLQANSWKPAIVPGDPAAPIFEHGADGALNIEKALEVN